MEKQFVTYEIAFKLKELGFDEECLATYIFGAKGSLLQLPGSQNSKDWKNSRNCSAPTWQQAFDWFESLGYEFTLTTNFEDVATKKEYWFDISKYDEDRCYYQEIFSSDIYSATLNTKSNIKKLLLETLIELHDKE